MAALLFTVLIEGMIIISVVVILFLLFFYLPFKNWMTKRRERKDATKKANNVLAPLMLLSDSYKEIIVFLERNAKYLNDEMLKKLLSRVEYLKADQFIQKNAKFRFKYNPELEEVVMVEREIDNESSISR